MECNCNRNVFGIVLDENINSFIHSYICRVEMNTEKTTERMELLEKCQRIAQYMSHMSIGQKGVPVSDTV